MCSAGIREVAGSWITPDSSIFPAKLRIALTMRQPCADNTYKPLMGCVFSSQNTSSITRSLRVPAAA